MGGYPYRFIGPRHTLDTPWLPGQPIREGNVFLIHNRSVAYPEMASHVTARPDIGYQRAISALAVSRSASVPVQTRSIWGRRLFSKAVRHYEAVPENLHAEENQK